MERITNAMILTKKESLCYYALIETGNKFNFGVSFGLYRAICKNDYSEWFFTEIGERNTVRIIGKFNNCYDACIYFINSPYNYISKEEKILATKYFKQVLNKKISEDKMIEFLSSNCSFMYDDLFFYDLVYKIKKVAGIIMDTNEQVEKRILMREKRIKGSYIDGTYKEKIGMFENHFLNFVVQIGDRAGIDCREYYDVNDDECAKKVLLKKVDISKYPELVIEELKKYDYSVSKKVLVRKKNSVKR